MTTISETIRLWSTSFVIQQGEYHLTPDAMSLRDQAPIRGGNDYTLAFTLEAGETPDNLPVDITGWTLSMIVKENLSDAVNLMSINATIINGPLGRFNVVIPAATFTRKNQIYGTYVIKKLTPTLVTLLYGEIIILPVI